MTQVLRENIPSLPVFGGIRLCGIRLNAVPRTADDRFSTINTILPLTPAAALR